MDYSLSIAYAVKCTLNVTYPESYPDVLPDLVLEPSEGELEQGEMDSLVDQLKATVCEIIYTPSFFFSNLPFRLTMEYNEYRVKKISEWQ